MTLQNVFTEVWQMSITGTIAILAVLLIRLLLKHMPKIFSYVLWVAVLFRLLCPITITSEVSLLGALGIAGAENGSVDYGTFTQVLQKVAPETILSQMQNVTWSEGGAVEDAINTTLEDAQVSEETSVQTVAGGLSAGNGALEWGSVLSYIWLLGVLALVMYSVWKLVKLKKNLVVAQPMRENIYLADYINTPFVIGFIRPKIYLPSSLGEQEQSYVVMHERHHIYRGDHVWKVAAFVALCTHWFNPFVWLAFVLASKDMEMSCDEAVLQNLKPDIHAEYAQSLLRLATGRNMIAGAPLAFGEGDTKERVKNVIRYKKPTLWMIPVALLICIVVVTCLVTNPEKGAKNASFDKTYVAEKMAYDMAWYYPTLQLDEVYFGLTADMHLWGKGQLARGMSVEYWRELGTFSEFELNRDNFDDLFPYKGVDELNDSQTQEMDYNMELAAVRQENQRAWRATWETTEWALQYYLLEQKNGELYLACWEYKEDEAQESYGRVCRMYKLMEDENVEVQPGELTIGAEFESEACLYMTPLSSYYPMNGNSGYTYEVTKDAFLKVSKNKQSGETISLAVEKWEWQEFPFTDEEWAGLTFTGIGAVENISSLYEEMLYQPLEGREFLLRMDGKIWLVNKHPDGFLWSIYSLKSIPEKEE